MELNVVWTAFAKSELQKTTIIIWIMQVKKLLKGL